MAESKRDGRSSGPMPGLVAYETVVSLRVETDVAVAGALARRAALAAQLDPVTAAVVSTATRELASNVYSSVGEGLCVIRISATDISIEVRDSGPNIQDLEVPRLDLPANDRPTEDTRSPRGLGCDLEAVRRLMDTLEIVSTAPTGTVLRATKRRSLTDE